MLPARSRGLTEDELSELESEVAAQLSGVLVGILALQDAALLARLDDAYRTAHASAMSKTEYRELLLAIGALWGAEATTTPSPILDAWLDSALHTPAVRVGDYQARTHAILQPLTPYIRIRTRNDDRVRPNHQVMHLFTARSDWPGWIERGLPPWGWRCRCLPEWIPWQIARDLGLEGELPDGTGKLDEFNALGGADTGFPRDRFIFGGPAPVGQIRPAPPRL